MDTNNAVVATAGIVVVGTWAQEKPINVRIVVGGMFLAIGLSLMDQASPKLAGRFALLILVVAAFMYVPGIAYKTGLISSPPKGIWSNGVHIPKAKQGIGRSDRKK